MAQPFVTAGAPCAFACHWDMTRPAGTGQDYFGVARTTIGRRPCYEPGASPGDCAITLRFDFVKTAVARALAFMRDANEDEASRFAVGVFTFDNALHQVYPAALQCGGHGGAACAAGDDWAAALARVGLPPDAPGRPDTGIQPSPTPNGPGATNLPKALTDLALDLTPAGAGDMPQSPRKALVLMTDGLDDHADIDGRHYGAIDPALCQAYKSMGFTVFVLYTPYIPQMNMFYLLNIKRIAEATGPSSISETMRRCATDPTRDFIAADPADPAAIANALQNFVARAANL